MRITDVLAAKAVVDLAAFDSRCFPVYAFGVVESWIDGGVISALCNPFTEEVLDPVSDSGEIEKLT